MAWYLAPSLAVLRSEVDTRWPGRDHTSDGTIGDEAHQQTDSDHNPNARESVDAWDMDKDGVDVDAVIAAFQLHPSANYWIWQREIADRDDGWRRRAYSGENPHTQHVHFSIRQSATAEQDRRSWGLLEDDMPLSGEDISNIWSAKFGAVGNRVTASQMLAEARRDSAAAMAGVAQLRTEVAQLAAAEAARDAAAAQRDADLRKLMEQHNSGQIDAEAVVARMGELLSGSAGATEPV